MDDPAFGKVRDNAREQRGVPPNAGRRGKNECELGDEDRVPPCLAAPAIEWTGLAASRPARSALEPAKPAASAITTSGLGKLLKPACIGASEILLVRLLRQSLGQCFFCHLGHLRQRGSALLRRRALIVHHLLSLLLNCLPNIVNRLRSLLRQIHAGGEIVDFAIAIILGEFVFRIALLTERCL